MGTFAATAELVTYTHRGILQARFHHGGRLALIDFMKLLDKLDAWRKEWDSAKQKARSGYLTMVLETCHALVDIDSIRKDDGALLHERVKLLYRDTSTILRGTLQPGELRVVMDAMASARIYYWLRFFEGADEDEIRGLINRRITGSATYNAFSGSPSKDIVERAICAICPEALSAGLTWPPDARTPRSDDVPLEVLSSLKTGCLRDFAALEILVNKYAH